MNISIVGLGKLGSCMAAVYATKGHRVIGIDVNPSFVECMNQGSAPVKEKDLEAYIRQGKERLSATTEYRQAIHETDITFIIVPTPTDDVGGFTTEYVVRACESIGEALKGKDQYHLVVLTSTLLPGDCEEKIIPVLERVSGKTCGKDFGFCYSPEFIAIGSVIHDLLHPDFVLIGEHDERSGALLEAFYKIVTENHAPAHRMSIPSAELCKISLNSFLTMKITYANMLTEIAEKIPGVDIDAVTTAIGSDKRIGKQYLRGGLGYGGPCFPRDNRAFISMAEKRGVTPPYAGKTDEYNKSIVDRAVQKIMAHVSVDQPLAMIGLSYKPGTYLAEEAQPVLIARELIKQGYTIHLCNPDGNEHISQLFNDTPVVIHDDVKECIEAAQALFLSNIDASLQDLPLDMPHHITCIIDPWRQYHTSAFPDHVAYVPFGLYGV